jgi:hypothetical protein
MITALLFSDKSNRYLLLITNDSDAQWKGNDCWLTIVTNDNKITK